MFEHLTRQQLIAYWEEQITLARQRRDEMQVNLILAAAQVVTLEKLRDECLSSRPA